VPGRGCVFTVDLPRLLGRAADVHKVEA
jgi:hypothetical protein